MKPRGIIPRITAVCLSGVLLVGQLLLPSQASVYPEKEHYPVSFADMEVSGFDTDTLNDIFKKMDQLAQEKKITEQGEEELRTLYANMLEEIDHLTTQNSLVMIRYYQDYTNEEMAELQLKGNEVLNQVMDQCFQTLRNLADSKYSQVLEELVGKERALGLTYYEPISQKELELSQQEQALIQEYDRIMQDPGSVTVAGEEWTLDQLAQAPPADPQMREEITKQLQSQQYQQAGEVFVQLVQVRTELAKENGYDNYAAYAYEQSYLRDYSLKKSEKVRAWVKRFIVPVELQLYRLMFEQDSQEPSVFTARTDTQLLDTIQPFFATISPELETSFAFLREYGLYDIEARENKLPAGFTISLPDYGSAFVYNSPSGGIGDYSTMVHEFGHFNAEFYAPGPALWQSANLDISEIHSQALELLFADYAAQQFGAEGEQYRWNILYNLLYAVEDGCLYDEFQQVVYENPDMTLTEISQTFKTLSEEYGYYYPPGETESWYWVEVAHNFSSPMYYISYATSALSALDLWCSAQSDRQQAVDTYLRLSALDSSIPYRQATHEAGLRDIFQGGTIHDIADGVQRQIEEGMGVELLPLPMDWSVVVPWIMYLGVLGGGILLCVVIWRTRKKQESRMG